MYPPPDRKPPAWTAIAAVILLAAMWGGIYCIAAPLLPATDPPPRVELPTEVRGRPCRPIKLTAKTSGKVIRWHAPAGLALEVIADDGSTAVASGPPGRYEVTAWTAIDGVPTEAVVCVVLIESEVATAKPGASVGPLWVIVVEESADRTQATARVLGDVELWSEVRRRGHQWRILDRDSPTVAEKGYDRAAAGVELPALIVLDGRGRIIRVGPLPGTAAEALALAPEVTP